MIYFMNASFFWFTLYISLPPKSTEEISHNININRKKVVKNQNGTKDLKKQNKSGYITQRGHTLTHSPHFFKSYIF